MNSAHCGTQDRCNKSPRVPVAQYVRMSTEHQRYSTENQSNAIREYAAANGMEVVRTYEDNGKSGLNLRGRSALRSLLRDVESSDPGFQAILVYDVSRWGRFPDPDEAAAYVHACKSRGIPVIYCAEPFKNDGSLPSTLLIGLKRSMAAEYSRELSEKVFRGACTIARHGYRQGGPPGFGLRRQLIDENHRPKTLLVRGEKKSIQTDRVRLVPGPESEVATVLRIYRLFVEKALPERVIAATLNREGIYNGSDNSWTRSTIHQVLTNEKYIGSNIYNRRSFKLKLRRVQNPPDEWICTKNAFEPIVSLDLFNQAQAVIAARCQHLSDSQMLESLRCILDKRGDLSKALIDEEEASPSSSVFRTRFGSLLRAYSLIGHVPKRDYSYLQINQQIRAFRRSLLDEAIDGILNHGGQAETGHGNEILNVNGELRILVAIARCRQTPGGSYRWLIQLPTPLETEIVVVARMDSGNQKPQDFYVLPSLDLAPTNLPTREDNGFSLDAYRTLSLESLFELTRRALLMESS